MDGAEEDFLAKGVAALSLKEAVPIYLVGRRSSITLLDGTEYGSRGLGGAAEVEEDPWAAVGGLEAQVAELRQAIELPLLRPETFEQYGLKPPRGLLLTGPPGTGKSSVLRAAGREFRARGVHVMVGGGQGGSEGRRERGGGTGLYTAWPRNGL